MCTITVLTGGEKKAKRLLYAQGNMYVVADH